MEWWGILLIVIAFLAFTFLGGALATYLVSFHSPYEKQKDIFAVPEGPQYDPYREEMMAKIKKLSETPYEEVRIRSAEGYRLVGRYYEVREGAPLDLCFHGYRGTAIRDFCLAYELSVKAGHNVLLVDQRAHGDSQGHCLTLGLKERDDCRRWTRYAVKRFGPDVKITLIGVSMGASAVLMASDMGLPSNVKGIVADAPYSSPSAIVKAIMYKLRFPWKIVYPMTVAGAFLFGHFLLRDRSAADAVEYTAQPILIFHGEEDQFVPCWMSEEMEYVNPVKVKRYTFPGAGHALSYMVDSARYTKILNDFYAATLGE